MATHTCEICGKTIYTGDPCHFVKVKGDKRILWYCKECVKGGGKDDTAGKRH
jgi:ribosomal protein L24E